MPSVDLHRDEGHQVWQGAEQADTSQNSEFQLKND